MSIRTQIKFRLNGDNVALDDVGPEDMLLDYLRLSQRLTGTKEGCAEGDCGACTILVGRLTSDGLVYETVNACIRFLASLDGCHVVTVEHLSRGGTLHPVQKAMVEAHGSQCGFCTPGIVMSLYALWMEDASPSVDAIERALQGNLCRCTGYAPIVRAAQSVVGDPTVDLLQTERSDIRAALEAMQDGLRVDISGSRGRVVLPKSVDDLAEVLEELPEATLVSGATDVGLWVNKFMRPVSPVVHLSQLTELKDCDIRTNSIHIGAGVTYSEFEEVLRAQFPQIEDFWSRIGGWQVRNMGTIGGNIANGSPIGDTPPMLIALGAEITLRKGKARRTIPLESFFIDYGKQDLQSGEFVESIEIPKLQDGEVFAVHKISKRKDEDISSVCGGFWIKLDGQQIKDIRIVYGGMAATPKRAIHVEDRLRGKSWDAINVFQAQDGFAEDFEPISDARASAQYRAIVARNLLVRVYRDAVGDVEGVA